MYNISKYGSEIRLINQILFSEEKICYKKIKNIDYDKLVKIASSHLILPTIYKCLEKKNNLDFLPSDLSKYLFDIYKINHQRNLALLDEIIELNDILKRANIKFAFLKGASLISQNIYDDIGERMVGDIDFLFNPNQESKVKRIFDDNGYIKIKKNKFFKPRHLIRRINKKKVFAVEPHLRILETKNNYLISTKSLNDRINSNGIYTLNKFDTLKNSIYSHQINDYGHLRCFFNIRSLYDTYMILKKSNFNRSNFKLNNKYLKSYFLLSEKSGFEIFKPSKKNKMFFYSARIKFRKHSFLYVKLENLIINLFLHAKNKPKQFLELVKNKIYRKYIFDKLLVAFHNYTR